MKLNEKAEWMLRYLSFAYHERTSWFLRSAITNFSDQVFILGYPRQIIECIDFLSVHCEPCCVMRQLWNFDCVDLEFQPHKDNKMTNFVFFSNIHEVSLSQWFTYKIARRFINAHSSLPRIAQCCTLRDL